MHLSSQIKKYRSSMDLSQEELAEKIHVTQQTISNWEKNKSYPDINNLLLLSSVFDISLDQLVEKDIKIMEKEISKDELQAFNRDRVIFIYLLVLFIIFILPLVLRFSYIGFIIAALIYGATMYYAVKSEKRAKKSDIHIYKEIIAYIEEQASDEMDKTLDESNLSSPKFLFRIASAIITFLVCLVILLSLLVLWRILECLFPMYHF